MIERKRVWNTPQNFQRMGLTLVLESVFRPGRVPSDQYYIVNDSLSQPALYFKTVHWPHGGVWPTSGIGLNRGFTIEDSGVSQPGDMLTTSTASLQ